MTIHQLRRIRKKLELFEIEGFSSALGDIIDVMVEEGGGHIGMSEKGKEKLVKKLKEKYEKIIKDNSPVENKQQKLFE